MCEVDEKTWRKIEAEYIAGGTTYRKLSDKYGVPKSVIAKRGKDDGWSDKQGQIRDRISAKAVDRISDKKAEAMAAMVNLTDEAAAIADAVTAAAKENPELWAADTGQMRAYMSALKEFLAFRRDILGIPTEEQRIRREQLQLERERFEAEQAEKAARSESAGGVEIMIHAPDGGALDE